MAYIPNPIALTGITSNTTFIVPAGYLIQNIVVINNTANAITGGLKFGTTNGGIEVVVALAVGASLTLNIFDSALLQRFFSKTVDTTLYIQAVVSWNSANIDIAIPLTKIF